MTKAGENIAQQVANLVPVDAKKIAAHREHANAKKQTSFVTNTVTKAMAATPTVTIVHQLLVNIYV